MGNCMLSRTINQTVTNKQISMRSTAFACSIGPRLFNIIGNYLMGNIVDSFTLRIGLYHIPNEVLFKPRSFAQEVNPSENLILSGTRRVTERGLTIYHPEHLCRT